MINAVKTAGFASRLESTEIFLKPILEEQDGLPTALLNRMRELAEKILRRVQDNTLREQSGA